ncbi:CHASE domain-containing sensor histidine kinase [Vasconcelosia minhoensis]|uniref:CHASE domain-containing sensor histidine kinase n=1 Tax=Vasconcelosia minhoensis TaxID=3366354 RepID=UPI002AD495BB|nr:CHASE domain-containing protein [Romeria gracilis]
MTLAATAAVGRWERLLRQSEFQQHTNSLTTALQRTTNRYNELLLSISDLYRASKAPIDEATFSRFVQRSLGSYPGIQALEWAPLIDQPERAEYELWLEEMTNGEQASITERDRAGHLTPAAVRSSYVPVTFLEPWQSNEAALGFDLASNPTRRVALERARDTGMPAATGRIQLVQDQAEDQYSFLVFVPIYNQPAQSRSNRRQQLQGYILGVFRVADVVEESLRDLNGDIDFYIFDQSAQLEEQLLGFYNAQTRRLVTREPPRTRLAVSSLCPSGLNCVQTISLGQREWQILFLPSDRPYLLWRTLATLLIGLLITAVLLIYLARWQAELRRTRELSDLKLQLFSMASHELRTPLSVISVSAQSLGANRESLSLQQQEGAIARIQIAARRMGQLVNDILTLTRAEAGKLEFNPEIVELTPFCQQLFEQIQLKPGQNLSLEGKAVSGKAYLDKKLLHSILINLLSNAAKYSPEDSQIRLIVTAEAQSLHFQVADRGIGIPSEALEQIFEAFYRGKNVGAVPGAGLGLAVARTCADLHGGYLTVQSSSCRGTCLTAVLPRIE